MTAAKTLHQTQNAARKPGKRRENAKRAARRHRIEQMNKLPKKLPRSAVSIEKLAWQRIVDVDGFDAEGGVLELDEIDGVDIIYGQEDAQGRRTVQFLAPESYAHATHSEEEWVPLVDQLPEADNEAAHAAAEDYKQNIETSKTLVLDVAPFDDTTVTPYADFTLHTSLRRALHRKGFTRPTEIQQQTWNSALSERQTRDIIGVAETGSGKTLAYGLPILQDILSRQAVRDASKLAALILAPTRELAMQVRTHLCAIVQAACVQEEEATLARLPINVTAITGGMSIQKQRRMLEASGGPDIIVATPGRLADLIDSDRELAKSVRRARFLVLDEADRMVEHGHFAELDALLALTARTRQSDDTFEDEFAHASDSLAAVRPREDLRTFIFSATMSKDLQRNLKRSSRRTLRDEKAKGRLGALGDLIEKVDFRDPDPLVIDLIPEGGLASKLRECKIDCFGKDKDIYLYYFLLRYPGRSLVFLSSIDAIRRLHPIFTLLGLEPGVIHSGMQQRARLKSLDRFKTKATGLLFATDVAARGLDIPAVQHVIHYQLPRTADVYVHRSGRTARAGKEGLSVVLCSPEEKVLHRNILRGLERREEPADLPVDHSLLDQLKHRIALATHIDKEQHKISKANNDEHWLQNAAKDLELELTDETGSDGQSKRVGHGKTRKSRQMTGTLERHKADLRQELARPLRVKGISAKYLTSFTGGQGGLAESLIDESNHAALLGVKRASALDHIAPQSHKKRKGKQ